MSYDELYEWIEERYPDVIDDYDKWDRDQQELRDKVWSEYIEKQGRDDICPSCLSPIMWFQPKSFTGTLYVPCGFCDDGLAIQTDGDRIVTKNWVKGMIVGGKQ